jgi:putative phage-type endonuclease
MMVDLSQNTPEWELFRRARIGASDAAPILGISPWRTPWQLWQEKTGVSRRKITPQMQRGTALEEKARNCFCDKKGIQVKPKVFVHPEYDFLMASLDGICDDLQIAVEIKCNGKENHQLAIEGKVPDYYNAQLQHQMFVCELHYIYYYSFDGENGVVLTVLRDEDFIKNMLKKELDFYQCMIEAIQPTMTSKDYVIKENHGFQEACLQWKAVRKQLSELEKKEQSYRKILVEEADGLNCEGCGVRISKVVRKGPVDYKKIPELIGVDLDDFRSDEIISWKITETNGEYE